MENQDLFECIRPDSDLGDFVFLSGDLLQCPDAYKDLQCKTHRSNRPTKTQ